MTIPNPNPRSMVEIEEIPATSSQARPSLQAIRNRVEKDDLQEATALLSDLVLAYRPSQRNEVSALRQNIACCERAYRSNTIDFEVFIRYRSKITNSILAFLDDFV